MKNYVQAGLTVSLIAPYAVASGAGVLVGSIFGVAGTAAEAGASVEATRQGVFNIKKKAATAITAGAKVYWDDTAKEITPTASGNKLVGAALEAAATDDATANVLLDGAVR
jgi:predicted RecA/RadA family phage recombinase